LRDAGSSFRSSSRSLFLFLFLFTLGHCPAEDIWGVALPEARERLARGEADFLRLDDFDAREQAQAFRLGPGGPYYLALWFRDQGLPERARSMFRLQWSRGGGRWKEEAAQELLAEAAAGGQWEEVERLGREFLPSLRSAVSRWRCERAVAEALYWQHRDSELLGMLDRLESQGSSLGIRDEELQLFRAAACARLETPGWPEMFRTLFLRRRASELHPRAYSFLELENRMERFTPAEAAYFGAKSALVQGRAGEALDLLEKALPRLAPGRTDSSPVPAEAAAAAAAAGRPERGLALLLPLLDPGPEPGASPARPEALELAGRLALQAGDASTAERLLREAARDPADPARRDRAAWLLLDAARDRSREDFFQELGRQVSGWADPESFERLLDQEVSDLVSQRAWGDLARLRAALGAASPPEVGARLAFLAGRLASMGWGQEGADPAACYREAARLDAGGYYGWLARALLPPGERLEPAPPPEDNGAEEPAPGGAAPGGQDSSAEAQPPASSSPRAAEPFLMGFLELGLYQAGYERIRAERRGLTPAFLLRAARELNRRGQLLLSLRLMYLVFAAQDRPPRREELKLFYPLGYRGEVEQACAAEELPPALFYALVREESHFDPKIVSSAGAVGLTQLLPETGQEVARRMRLPEPDLQDPRQNLALGARYLSRMLGLTGDVPRGLMAYNAGLSRLRSWDRDLAGLPAELLVEAAPFSETRRYVRKILVSAVHYGSLYFDLSPLQAVRLFYPHFGQPGEPR
jgi:soluble lytic murein transglycosylase